MDELNSDSIYLFSWFAVADQNENEQSPFVAVVLLNHEMTIHFIISIVNPFLSLLLHWMMPDEFS